MEGKKHPPAFWQSAGGDQYQKPDFLWKFRRKNMFFRYPVLLSRKNVFLWKMEKRWKWYWPPLRLKAKLEIFDIYQNYKTLIFMFFSFFPRKFILWTAYFTFSTFWKLYFHATLYPKSHINEFGKHRKSKISLNGGSGKTWFCIKKKCCTWQNPLRNKVKIL